ncbi:hypothetical protein DL767_009826 [Monosporascus sp. MG133]|nr:hypothetical protein DL767_009826 [Monosporascus sp. MG133]
MKLVSNILIPLPGQGLTEYPVRREFKVAEYFYGLSIDANNSTHVKSLLPVELSTAGFEWPGSSGSLKKSSGTKVAHVIGKSDVNASLKVTGVDKLHKLGLTSKGIKIGIIDSGIDYRYRHWAVALERGSKLPAASTLSGMIIPAPIYRWQIAIPSLIVVAGATIEYVRIVPVDDPAPFQVSNVPGDEQYCTQPYWNDAAAYFEGARYCSIEQ